MELGNLTSDNLVCAIPFGKDAEVTLKYLSRSDLQELRSKVTRREYRKGQIEEVMDAVEFNRALGRLAVKGWKGITVNGADFPYSPENADVLMARSYAFSEFVNDTVIDIARFTAEAEAAAKKN